MARKRIVIEDMSTLVIFENDLIACKVLVDEMIRTDDCGLIHQLEADMGGLLKRIRDYRQSGREQIMSGDNVAEAKGEVAKRPALSARAAVSVAIQSWRKQEQLAPLDDKDLQQYVDGTIRHPGIAPLVEKQDSPEVVFNEVISLLNGIMGRR